MPYKYQAHLMRCPDQPCPDSGYRLARRSAYRFLHNAARVPDDFKPPALTANPPAKPTCGSYALSFVASLDLARKRYASLSKRIGGTHAALRYGDHIGRIELTEQDGAQCAPDKHGHFDLHEEESVNWNGRVLQYWSVKGE